MGFTSFTRAMGQRTVKENIKMIESSDLRREDQCQGFLDEICRNISRRRKPEYSKLQPQFPNHPSGSVSLDSASALYEEDRGFEYLTKRYFSDAPATSKTYNISNIVASVSSV
uniref:Uncharacterized protein n=1 Tax=Romanomermis culicivorax TaxID=13658 RepID=A0A915KJ58_ROMCU